MVILNNPELIQTGTGIPLFLIHDGSGSSTSYNCLNDLGRPIYAIHNPRLFSRRPWAGGVREMAQVYLELIKATCPTTQFIVGGWSFGGVVALEIALQCDELNCIGVLLIDSPCPNQTRYEVGNLFPTRLPNGGYSSLRKTMNSQFKQTAKMLSDYEPPLRRSQWSKSGKPDLPPVTLLRATESVQDSLQTEDSHEVDTYRHRKSLGWEAAEFPLVTAVLDIPGHHYSVFDNSHTPALTKILCMVCARLEGKDIWE